MTILTKPDILISKLDVVKSPLFFEDKSDGELSEPESLIPKRKKCATNYLIALMMISMMLTGIGVIVGSIVYQDAFKAPGPVMQNFHGFCSIKIPKDDFRFGEYGNDDVPYFLSEALIQPEFAGPDVEVFSTTDDVPTFGQVNSLKEKLDIADNVEKIMVIDNGQNFNFVHDFTINISGIVEPTRCYVMELDPEVVLPPETFVSSIAGGDQFDVSPVRAVLRALLPALRNDQFVTLCGDGDRPRYRLARDDSVRKRRSATPAPQYRHFSGRHVQHIEIRNLDEVLAYEKGKA